MKRLEHQPLESSFSKGLYLESGVDEAGRGSLVGDVFAAAVILPRDFYDPRLNDSKQLSQRQREALRPLIEEVAISWAIGRATAEEIDRMNILQATFLAMHRAVEQLQPVPELILVDGNRFRPYGEIPYETIVKGDGKFLSIATASILAKTHRDEYMLQLAERYPEYGWQDNMGYPTQAHRAAIAEHGAMPLHRKSFKLLP